MPERVEDEKDFIMIKRSLLKKMIEKLKIVENIEDMTDVEDIKELIKEQS